MTMMVLTVCPNIIGLLHKSSLEAAWTKEGIKTKQKKNRSREENRKNLSVLFLSVSPGSDISRVHLYLPSVNLSAHWSAQTLLQHTLHSTGGIAPCPKKNHLQGFWSVD